MRSCSSDSLFWWPYLSRIPGDAIGRWPNFVASSAASKKDTPLRPAIANSINFFPSLNVLSRVTET